MRVSEAMTREVRVATPGQSIREVAKMMAEIDAMSVDVMTSEVRYCFEDEDLEHVAKNMGDVRVRRLPVVNREKRLVGIVALGDIARKEDHATTGQATAGVSQPGGKHQQT